MYVIINDTFNDEYFSNEYNVTVLTFINQVNTALFHTITSADYRPYNSYVYFFLRNSQGGEAALANLCTLAHYSIYDAIDKSIRLNIIFICGIVPVSVLVCVILGTMIARAIRRKADYLAVFFDIGNSTIKNSLEKCEIFNTKIQSDNISGEEEGDEEIKSKEEKEIDVKNEVKHHSRGHAKANSGNSEILKIRIFISVIFVIIDTIVVIMFIFDNTSTQKIKKYIGAFETIIANQNDYLKLISNVREFIFGSNMYVGLDSYENDFNAYYLGYMAVIAGRNKGLANLKSTMPKKIYEIYNNLYEKDNCNTTYTNLEGYFNFPDDVDCYEIFFNSSQYGFKILLTTLTMEIRSIKNSYESLQKRQNDNLFKYNCSLMGTEKEKNLFPNSDTTSEEYLSYIEMHPINVYNSEENYVINRIYRYILSNTFPLFGNKFSKEIVNGINYIKKLFYCHHFCIHLRQSATIYIRMDPLREQDKYCDLQNKKYAYDYFY